MAEFFLTVFIFVGVIAVTALVFGGWVVFNVFRGILNMLGIGGRRTRLATQQAMGGWPQQHQQAGRLPGPTMYAMGTPPGMIQCGLPGCRHLNPATARFCRRCGHAFPQAQRVVAAPRRAVV